MSISKRYVLAFGLIASLAACGSPVIEEEVVIIESVVAEPVFETMTRDCETGSTVIDDGIGGTGCKID